MGVQKRYRHMADMSVCVGQHGNVLVHLCASEHWRVIKRQQIEYAFMGLRVQAGRAIVAQPNRRVAG